MNKLGEYLNQDIDNPKYLFHGSPEKLDKVIPLLSNDSKDTKNNIAEAVFLFPSFLKSIPYSFKDTIKEGNEHYDFSIPNRNVMPIMTIRQVENINENIIGYIYVFKKDNKMIKDEGDSYQYKCYEELIPVDIVEVCLKDYLKYISIKERLVLEDFILDEYDFSDIEHIKLKNELIESEDSELISRDINNYIKRNYDLRINDNITNTYIIKYHNEKIGLAFVNYHPEEKYKNELLPAEIEIVLGLLSIFRGKHLGQLLEKELSVKLLKKYPSFNEIVARIDNDNIKSINVANSAGFVHIKDDQYYLKRK